MTKLVIALIALLLALAGIVVRKTYYALPVRELKRRAETREDSVSHEEMIALLHQVDAKQGR